MNKYPLNTSEWIKTTDTDKRKHIIYKCGICGYRTTVNETWFCPKCGVEMKKKEKGDKGRGKEAQKNDEIESNR